VTGGSIKLDGKELVGLAGAALRAARRDVQMIFQDPYSSLNPRLRAGAIVEGAVAPCPRWAMTANAKRGCANFLRRSA
jgi:ABC-type microcin C transport system duplicated ATPase subunit YejF